MDVLINVTPIKLILEVYILMQLHNGIPCKTAANPKRRIEQICELASYAMVEENIKNEHPVDPLSYVDARGQKMNVLDFKNLHRRDEFIRRR